ncbi:MAG: hypothetical protein WCN98_18090, partial [Verrucomicrobiaceae bacterium]
KLDEYQSMTERLHLPDEVVQSGAKRGALAWSSLWLSVVALLGLPLALYGWLHRLIPFAIVRWSVSRFAAPRKHKAQVSTAAMIAGLVAFVGFYGVCVALCHWIWGWPVSFWYALSLPFASMAAHYYAREVGRLFRGLRTLWILCRVPFAARQLVEARKALVAEIESVHQERWGTDPEPRANS